MITLRVLLLIAALVLVLVAAVGAETFTVGSARLSLLDFGLAAFVASFLTSR
jgi:hypothetical protein